MKKLFLMMAFSVLGTGAITAKAETTFVQQGPGAQDQATPAERVERQLKMMTEQLSLSAEQSEKLKPVLLQQMTERQELRQKMQGSDRQAMMTEMKTMQEKYDAQFKTILTADQYTKYQANQAQMRNGRGGQRQGQGGAAQTN